MNVELKRIAEKKLEQMGGDVCGVLVRKNGRLAAVDEHGRVQWLQDGQGAEPVFWWDGDLSDLDGCVRKEQSAYHTTPLYTRPHNGEQGGEWIKCSERLPTEYDADCDGMIWVNREGSGVVCAFWDTLDIGTDTHWMPTGLKRPQPPQQGGAE